MTAIGRDEAIERLEAAWTCEHLACQEQRRLVAQAQGIAAALEAEVHALTVLLRYRFGFGDHIKVTTMREAIRWELEQYAYTGKFSADAFSLVAVLEAGGDTA